MTEPTHLKKVVGINYNAPWQPDELVYRRFVKHNKRSGIFATTKSEILLNDISVNRQFYSSEKDVLWNILNIDSKCFYDLKNQEIGKLSISKIINSLPVNFENVVYKASIIPDVLDCNISHCLIKFEPKLILSDFLIAEIKTSLETFAP
jgi:hypothetical protein